MRPALALCGALIAVRLAAWALAIQQGHVASADALLQHFDASWYSRILGQGYVVTPPEPTRWAFYPLYPLTVRGLLAVTDTWPWQAFVGAGLSTACLLGFVALLERQRDHPTAGALCPRTPWGWAWLLASPAAYALHSHHTEALFLLLSGAAFVAALRDRPWLAAALAGLSALTRTQGVLVAVAVAAIPRDRRTFALSGLISGALWSLWPAYAWWMTGDPWRFLSVQAGWGGTASPGQIAGGLVLANPWQPRDAYHLLRHATWCALAVGCVPLVRRHPALGWYCAVALLLDPMRAFLSDATYRFAAVLFPLWFLAGDRLATSRLRWPLTLGLVALSTHVAWRYAASLPAY